MNGINDSANYYIGLISGTSADGVDAALIETTENSLILKSFLTHPYPAELRQALINLNTDPTLKLEDFCQIQYDVAKHFAESTNKLLDQSGYEVEQISGLGSHGQTIYHAPNIPMTLQIGSPAIIAKQTGIDTVGELRLDNMAVGGQGAPLAPAFHKTLFETVDECFAVNIGGISNISRIPSAANESINVIGFDTGPGNGLMDELCQREFNCEYDANGEIAAQAAYDAELLSYLLQHPYFAQPSPKSTGRETFHLNWVDEVIANNQITVSPQELMATLCELTAVTIAHAIQQNCSIQDDSDHFTMPVWIVGGGALNPILIERIQANLPRFQVASSQTIGIDPNAIEAMMCAWLAQQRINLTPIELSSVTGADKDVILGGLWSAN